MSPCPWQFFILILSVICTCWGYGYDSGSDQGACGKPIRSAKAIRPPCDLQEHGFCTNAGSAYPWHAVRRFIRENQGLMKRMYGSERQITILKAELETNEIENEESERYSRQRQNDLFFHEKESNYNYNNNQPRFFQSHEERPRYFYTQDQARILQDAPQSSKLNKEQQEKKKEAILERTKLYQTNNKLTNKQQQQENGKRDEIMNTKFVYSEEPNLSVKLSELKAMPHFRPTTPKINKTDLKLNQGVNNKTGGGGGSNNNLFEGTSYYENITESFMTTKGGDEENTTASSEYGELIKTTTAINEEIDGGTTTSLYKDEEEEEEITTEESKKSAAPGTVLFQDMEDSNKIPVNTMNYKLRGVNACPVKEEVVAPFWANNTRGEVLALLNLYPFEQYVHWEKCTYEHRQMYCREGCRCEQQYRLHRLLAYDPRNECRGIFSDWFRFPSCCVCKCYDMPPEFRVTSRSPRNKEEVKPNWFKKRNNRNVHL